VAGFYRTFRHGANIGLSIIIFLAIMVAVALIAQNNPWRIDLTRGDQHSLSPQTKKIVSGLKNPILITAFYQETQDARKGAKELLESYKYLSSKITYRFVDPDRQPAEARKYDVKSYGTLVLEGYGKKQSVTAPDESAVTNGILKLVSKKEKIAYFLTGHGERDIDDNGNKGLSSLKQAIEKENYTVKKLNLMRTKVPEETTFLVIADPQKPLFKEELDAIESYIKTGGRLLVLSSAFGDGGLKEFLARYGFQLKDDIVVDRMSRVFGGDYLMPLINSYGQHEITEKFTLAAFLPLARSVEREKELPKGVTITDLALTSQDSWSETNQKALNEGTAEFNEKEDKMGPLVVAALASIQPSEEAKNPSKKDAEKGQQAPSGTKPEEQDTETQFGELAVFGSADFVANQYLELAGNSDFILNTVNFLGKEENQISIRPKAAEAGAILLSREQNILLLWVSLVLMPVIILLSAFIAYRIRRRSK
jgi:ABC-type uncharacterized transport system involved in gliding motility auxiliary subunit